MLNKRGFALLLLLLVAFSAVSQEDAGSFWNRVDGLLNTAEERLAPSQETADTERPSFTIHNNTGFVVRSVFIRKAGETSWGDNILIQPLYNGRSISVRLDQSFDPNALYSIRMVDIDNDSYTKHNQSITRRSRISIGVSDLEF